jgi:hypothetical protein
MYFPWIVAIVFAELICIIAAIAFFNLATFGDKNEN